MSRTEAGDFLAFWRRPDGAGGFELVMRALSATGPTADESVVATTTVAPWLASATGPHGVVVAWSGGPSDEERSVMTRRYGVVTGDAIVVDDRRGSGSVDVAFDDMQGVVVYDVAEGIRRRVFSRRIDFEGTPTRPAWFVSEPGEFATSATTSAYQGGFLVAYRGYQQGTDEPAGVILRFVHGSTGLPVLRVYLEESGVDDGSIGSAVASDGSVLISWATTDATTLTTELRAARVSCPGIWLRCSK